MTSRIVLAIGILTTLFLAGCDTTPVPIDSATPSAAMIPSHQHIKGAKT
jgi:hypothetical protein